ncbi:glycosyltransferase [Oceanirhabdus seepicola]|uniref:Glycosyltransferase family 2 protein n=1 Tax=Oceanirhabdus seepicola TaxID=2828781 RepID=A0A9J6NYD8_9CLOT|nr:glycosyltransferase family 2 protein [Oceanirhabdus seepicola]MCM1989283.1 glycosyltransferase family 2 protein [Oceanirhabdus seepicola]
MFDNYDKLYITEEKSYKEKESELYRQNYFIDIETKENLISKPYIRKEQQIDNIKLLDNIAQKFKCEYIIDVGCMNLNGLLKLKNKYKIIGIDLNIVENLIEDNDMFYIKCELDFPNKINLSKELLQKSIIICSNAIEKIKNKGYLLSNIREFMNYSQIGLITTLDREISSSNEAIWEINEFKKVLNFYNFNLQFIGLGNKCSNVRENIMCILGNNNKITIEDDIKKFRVVAIIIAYNEEDILYHSIAKLKQNGIDVYLIDNWSTDSTFKIINKLFKEKKIIGFERFPKDESKEYYDLYKMMERKEILSKQIKANWFIHHDVDEIREGPWENLNLKESIYLVDKMGYNAIDHSVIEFKPIDNSFISGDFEKNFKYFIFPGSKRINAWKNIGENIDLKNEAGHEVKFASRIIFPINFLIKHYPMRSQLHAEKKMIKERKERAKPENVKKGWHWHYSKWGGNAIGNPKNLILFNKEVFSKYYLMERIISLKDIKKCIYKSGIFGCLDAPVKGEVIKSKSIFISGWAFSENSKIDYIEIKIDNQKYRATTNIRRKDVGKAYSDYKEKSEFSGFNTIIKIPDENLKKVLNLRITVYAQDGTVRVLGEFDMNLN